MTPCAHDFDAIAINCCYEDGILYCPLCHADITAEYLAWQEKGRTSKSLMRRIEIQKGEKDDSFPHHS